MVWYCESAHNYSVPALFLTFARSGGFHWEQCSVLQEHPDHIQTWKLPNPSEWSAGYWTAPAVGVRVKGLAQGHFSGGNKGRPSASTTPKIKPTTLRSQTRFSNLWASTVLAGDTEMLQAIVTFIPKLLECSNRHKAEMLIALTFK